MYRVLGQVLVMVVTPSWSNSFSSANVLSAVVRVITSETRGLDVSADRILKKYAVVGPLHLGPPSACTMCPTLLDFWASPTDIHVS